MHTSTEVPNVFEARKVTRRRETRELVDTLVANLNVGDEASRSLWEILTALRGPDQESNDADEIKYRTTSRFRGLIGMESTIGLYPVGAIVYHEKPSDVLPNDSIVVGHHFLVHYTDALAAANELGFKYEAK